MANITKCKECGKPVPSGNPIITDEANSPMRFCSLDCMNRYYEKEATADLEAQEFDSRCSIAIAKALEANPGMTFEEASYGTIMGWFEEYGVYDKKNLAQR